MPITIEQKARLANLINSSFFFLDQNEDDQKFLVTEGFLNDLSNFVNYRETEAGSFLPGILGNTTRSISSLENLIVDYQDSMTRGDVRESVVQILENSIVDDLNQDLKEEVLEQLRSWIDNREDNNTKVRYGNSNQYHNEEMYCSNIIFSAIVRNDIGIIIEDVINIIDNETVMNCLINSRDNHGNTALHLVAQYSNSADMAETIIFAGGNAMTLNNEGNNPIHLSVINNSLNVLNEILGADADSGFFSDEDINQVNLSGLTPLDYTYPDNRDDQQDLSEMRRFLISRGANDVAREEEEESSVESSSVESFSAQQLSGRKRQRDL